MKSEKGIEGYSSTCYKLIIFKKVRGERGGANYSFFYTPLSE